jgi:3-methyl-2-oxobutanoate hydroxymethyltransferase
MPVEKNVASKKSVGAQDLLRLKQAGQKIVCLTAYDFGTASLLEEAEIDLILVGDSLANVILGLENTYQVGLAEMIHHTKAVARAVKKAFLVTDLPFLTYQISIEDAILNAAELMKAGAKGVKLEGATSLTLAVVERLTQIGIPVIGHLGYTPQSASTIGRGKVQAKTEEAASKLLTDAKALEEAGAIAIVLEMIPASLAKKVSESLLIPTISIGAGKDCDGQVLVIDDLLGKTPFKFKFSKRYAEQGQETIEAAKKFAFEVRNGLFPSAENSF